MRLSFQMGERSLNLHHIKGSCYYFSGAVNIGYIQKDGYGVLIDAGLESSASKKVLRTLEKEGFPLDALVITHAHADHYGGAAYVQKNRDIKIYAPALEAAILENPVLEPIYLFNGASPLKDMRNKFVEGEPVKVDYMIEDTVSQIGPLPVTFVHLPGHSYNQYGLIVEDVLFASDGYFGREQLEKHKIPYIVDAETTLKSLEKLKGIHVYGAVPGHGAFETNFVNTIDTNIDYHQKVLSVMKEVILEDSNGVSFEGLLVEMCRHFSVQLKNVGSWMLYRTAVSAYVTKLVANDFAKLEVINNKLYVQKKEGEA